MFRYFDGTMIEMIFFWMLIVLALIYANIHLFAWRGLNNLVHPKSEKLHSFSIIVAARNEEKNITQLLSSLLDLDYPKEKFEIIIVNDRSTDSTKEKAENSAYNKNVKIITITENNSDMPHKKNALRTGINKAQFDILAFTDADCIVEKDWLKQLASQFTDDVGVVAGYSPFSFDARKSMFNSFLRYEELQGSLSAAAGIGLNNTYMCTGRNFAYRKKVYDEVGGFEKIKHSISGDDDLFIQLVHRETAWKMRYMTSPDSYVKTKPPLTLKELINQRTRHISASKYYTPRMKAIFGLSHIFLIAILVEFFISPFWALLFLLVRMNLHAFIIARGKELLNEEFSVVEFFRNEILLILYTILIGPLGLLKKFDWKGATA